MPQYSPPTYHTQTKTTSIIHRYLLQTNPKSHPPTSPQYHNNQTYSNSTNAFLPDQQTNKQHHRHTPSRNKPRLQQPPKTLTNLISKIEMWAPPKLTTIQTQIQHKPDNISHLYQMRRGPGEREILSITLSFQFSPQNLIWHHYLERSLDEA